MIVFQIHALSERSVTNMPYYMEETLLHKSNSNPFCERRSILANLLHTCLSRVRWGRGVSREGVVVVRRVAEKEITSSKSLSDSKAPGSFVKQ